MQLKTMSMFTNFVSTLRQFVVKTPQIQPVRYRYHAEKKEYIRRYGYEDKLARSGLLAHYGEDRIKPFPQYKYEHKPNQCVQSLLISSKISDQKMCGMRSALCLAKMITLTFLAMTICTRPDFYTIFRHGFVAQRAMNTNCCCANEKCSKNRCIQSHGRPNGEI